MRTMQERTLIMAKENGAGGDPNAWVGTRDIKPSPIPCGFCRTDEHKICVHEIAWFSNLWVCSCECNNHWKPKNVIVTKKPKAVQTKEEVTA